jgi:hypothetical protein
MASDIERAYKAITDKRPGYDLAWSYYDGAAPLKYSTERLRQAFESMNVYFAENWLQLVVTSVLDRLTLKGFSVNGTSNSDLDKLFASENMQLTSYDVHEAGLVTSESFVIAERDEEGNVSTYYNDPRLCHVFYKADKPKEKEFACKYWQDEGDGAKHLVLYYPDRFEYYSASKNASTARGFNLDSVEANETGVIPVFHFRNTRRGKGEFGVAEYSMQDAANKLFSDMLVAAEFTSVKQRVIISKADPGDLKTFENWWIPDSDAKVQEVGGAELTNFLDAIDRIAQAMGIITRTPKHYFFAQGGDPSGDALIAMEAPLTKKVTQRQENYAVTWKEVASYMLKLMGTEVDASAIMPIWGPIETLQPMVSAQILQVETSAGVPLKVAAKRQGWADDELKELSNNSQRDAADANNDGRDAQKE